MPAELPVLPELRMDLAAPEVDGPIGVASLIGDRTRAGILAMLRDGPHCVCELAAALDERPNNVSMHLARLRDAGLVRTSHFGGDSRRVYYERDQESCAAALAELRMLLEPAG